MKVKNLNNSCLVHWLPWYLFLSFAQARTFRLCCSHYFTVPVSI